MNSEPTVHPPRVTRGLPPHVPSTYSSVSLLGSQWLMKSAWNSPLPAYNAPALTSPCFIQRPSPVQTSISVHIPLYSSYLLTCLSSSRGRKLLGGRKVTKSYLYSQHLALCLTHRKFSINVCWIELSKLNSRL